MAQHDKSLVVMALDRWHNMTKCNVTRIGTAQHEDDDDDDDYDDEYNDDNNDDDEND